MYDEIAPSEWLPPGASERLRQIAIPFLPIIAAPSGHRRRALLLARTAPRRYRPSMVDDTEISSAANLATKTPLLKPGWAFGVDPHRRERYSLRQSRYDALAEDISAWAAVAARAGETLSVLDVGCGPGFLLRHLEAKPHFDRLAISATELSDGLTYRSDLYRRFFLGDLMDDYPEIPSNAYDVVVCEQVLEHVADLGRALDTLVRLVKPGGRLVIGVPVFLPPLHLARMHLVPLLDRLLRRPHDRGHVRAFSLRTLLRDIAVHKDLEVQAARGFRVISGGILRPLENYRWWWKFNRWLGERIPAACIEIQAIMRKPPDATGDVAHS
jgi:SAM-dependent methyltransferase